MKDWVKRCLDSELEVEVYWKRKVKRKGIPYVGETSYMTNLIRTPILGGVDRKTELALKGSLYSL